MSGCLYYLPARRFDGKRVPDVLKGEQLAAVGLGHLKGAAISYRGVRNGAPDGGAGLVLGVNHPTNETGVFPDQHWQPCDGGDLFIGWPKDAQPGPSVFERKDALAATDTVVMADGNPWGFIATKALPEVMGFDSSGNPAWTPRVCDAAHFDASQWLMEYLLSGEDRMYTDIVARVATCLGARYHVGMAEVMALRLFSTDLNVRVVCACLGIDYDELTGKKNEGDA